MFPHKVPNHLPEQKIRGSCLLLRPGNSNFLLRGVIWHLLLAMGSKSKYLLRLSHLYHVQKRKFLHYIRIGVKNECDKSLKKKSCCTVSAGLPLRVQNKIDEVCKIKENRKKVFCDMQYLTTTMQKNFK